MYALSHVMILVLGRCYGFGLWLILEQSAFRPSDTKLCVVLCRLVQVLCLHPPLPGQVLAAIPRLDRYFFLAGLAILVSVLDPSVLASLLGYNSCLLQLCVCSRRGGCL